MEKSDRGREDPTDRRMIDPPIAPSAAFGSFRQLGQKPPIFSAGSTTFLPQPFACARRRSGLLIRGLTRGRTGRDGGYYNAATGEGPDGGAGGEGDEAGTLWRRRRPLPLGALARDEVLAV